MKVRFHTGSKDKHICTVDLPCPPRVGETVRIHIDKDTHTAFVKGVLWSLWPKTVPDQIEGEHTAIVIMQ